MDPDDAHFDGMTRDTRLCRVVHERRTPQVDPEFGRPIRDVIRSPALRRAVVDNMESLYRYQDDAFDAISSGRDVVITAPTASGKTEAFLLPVLDMMLAGNRTAKPSALFIYPTRALTADQASNISKYADRCGITIRHLDGSVDQTSRKRIVADPPDIIATNFDMLAYHMPRHEKSQFSAWLAGMLGGVGTVVVDEAHTCTGFYGANVRWILYRLLRFNPGIQFVASSATMGDPIRFCSGLFPRPMHHVDGTGARGEAVLRFLEPAGSKKSLMIALARQFGLKGYQSLAFSNSRREAEILAIDGSDEGISIEVHRSGMDEKYRAAVEAGLRDGTILAVSCTPTLELGINIGNMKSVSSDYVPHDRLVQRMGRAGRRGQMSFAYMVLDGSDAITSYYLRNPERYFEDRTMHVAGHDNDLVDENQLMLMAMDRNLTEEEAAEHGAMIERLKPEGLMNRTWCTLDGRRRALAWTIRDIGAKVSLYAAGRNVGSIEMPAAFTMLYPGAILLHQKTTYRVQSIRAGKKYGKALLARERTPNITNPVMSKSYEILRVISSRSVGLVRAEYCRVRVKRRITAYVESLRSSDAEGETHELAYPEYLDTDTLGVRIVLPAPGEAGAVHSAEHLMIHAARMVIGAETNEIGGTTDPESIILYDNSMSGGNGLSKGIYDNLGAIIERATEMVSQCDCREVDGCPRCVHMIGCSTSNQGLLKQGAMELLGRLLGTQDAVEV